MSRYELPDPAAFCVDHLKNMNETSWRGLAAVVAGLPFPEGRDPPDAEDRERAALLIHKAMELLQAENIDQAWAVLGKDARHVVSRSATLAEFVESMRSGVATYRERGLPAVEEWSSDPAARAVKIGTEALERSGGTMEGVADVYEAVCAAWDAMRLHRESEVPRDPVAAPGLSGLDGGVLACVASGMSEPRVVSEVTTISASPALRGEYASVPPPPPQLSPEELARVRAVILEQLTVDGLLRREFPLGTGETVTVRTHVPDDDDAVRANAEVMIGQRLTPESLALLQAGYYLTTVNGFRMGVSLLPEIPGVGIVGHCYYDGSRVGMSLLPDWQGCGVGTALMTVLIDWARANPGIRLLRLTARLDNPRAIAFYERMGFKVEREWEGHFVEGPVDVVRRCVDMKIFVKGGK